MFNQYPYININDFNLDWIIAQIRKLRHDVEDFVNMNAIKYADPIDWDITKQYEKNTVVIDANTGVAYLSVAPVPAGVNITRPEYWTVIFDLSQFITAGVKNLANSYESALTYTATVPTLEGGWVVWNGTLYEALNDIHVGDAYVEGGNIIAKTVESFVADVITAIGNEATARINADNALDAKIGNLANLNTTDKTSAVNAINEVLSDVSQEAIDRANADNALHGEIGTLANLNTTDKTNLVNAINEVDGDLAQEITDRANGDNSINNKIGNLANLNTSDNTNLVNAINEVYADANGDAFTFVTPQKFGAVGDGVTDDTTAVQLFFNECLQGKIGIVPAGTYICSSPIIIDYSTANIRQLKILGAGAYRSMFRSTITSAGQVAFLFTSGVGVFDSFHTVIDDVAFISNHDGVCAQIGKDDVSDAMGNYNFNNVLFSNEYINGGVGARFNYLFDCVFTNCIYLCSARGVGAALQLRLCRFCTFIGGSYSNAGIGIHFMGENTGCDSLTFIGSDFENLEYGVMISSPTNISQYVKFITCYFDIWRPDLTPPTYGKNAVYSDGGGVGGIQFDNCVFARGGIYGNGGVDTAHIKNCHFIGKYSYDGSTIPASGVAWTNNTGQDQFCYMYTLNSDNASAIMGYSIADDLFPNLNTDIQLGYDGSKTCTVIIHAGATITPYYNGTAYWQLRPVMSY